MAKRRVAKIVRQAQSLCQVLIQSQSAGKNAPDLRDFKAVREPGAIMVPIRGDKDLCLRFEPAKAHRMDNAIAVALEIGARAAGFIARTNVGRTARAAEFAATMGIGICGVRRERCHDNIA